MRKAIVDGRTGITCARRSDGSVAVLFDDSNEITWLPEFEALSAIQD